MQFQTTLISGVYIAVIKVSYHGMLRMALNRHKSACYHRQRKRVC